MTSVYSRHGFPSARRAAAPGAALALCYIDAMTSELDVLRIVSERLAAVGISFMLTGSYAMAYYATPRMTRDLDLVLALGGEDVDRLVAVFSHDFYVDADAARSAVRTQQLFNLLHLESGVKVDFIVRKDSEYRQLEFSRRKRIELNGIQTWIVSREDLILSKLVWARHASSELQRRDVKALLDGPYDQTYVQQWAALLEVADLLKEIAR